MQFEKVKEAVSKSHQALQRDFQEEMIYSQQNTGIKIAIPIGLIPLDVFAMIFKLPAKTVCPNRIITMPAPDGQGDIEGVCMRLSDIPDNVPRYTGEMYSTSTLNLRKVLLSPDAIVRQGQAPDEYKVRSKMISQERQGVFKRDSLLKLKSFNLVMKTAQEIGKERENAAAMEQQEDPEDKTPERPNDNVVCSSRFLNSDVASSGKKTDGKAQKRSRSGAQGGPAKRAKADKADDGASVSGISVAIDGADPTNADDGNHGVDVLGILEGKKLGREIKGVLRCSRKLRPAPGKR